MFRRPREHYYYYRGLYFCKGFMQYGQLSSSVNLVICDTDKMIDWYDLQGCRVFTGGKALLTLYFLLQTTAKTENSNTNKKSRITEGPEGKLENKHIESCWSGNRDNKRERNFHSAPFLRSRQPNIKLRRPTHKGERFPNVAKQNETELELLLLLLVRCPQPQPRLQ